MASYYPTEDIGLNIARGLVKGTSHINKFGYNSACGTSYETVWNGGGTYVYPTIANTVVLSANSNADFSGNTGAQIVTVQGLDENYDEATVTVPLAGTSDASNTDVNFIRVFRMQVTSAGSSGTNQSIINANINGSLVSRIDTGDGQTLQCNYTVPNGYKGYITDMMVNTGKDNQAGFAELVVRPVVDGGWQIKQLVQTYRNTVTVNYPVPLEIGGKSDIEIQAKGDTGSIAVSSTFNITLIKDGLG